MRDMLEILLSALGHPASPYQEALLIGSLSSSGHFGRASSPEDAAFLWLPDRCRKPTDSDRLMRWVVAK